MAEYVNKAGGRRPKIVLFLLFFFHNTRRKKVRNILVVLHDTKTTMFVINKSLSIGHAQGYKEVEMKIKKKKMKP